MKTLTTLLILFAFTLAMVGCEKQPTETKETGTNLDHSAESGLDLDSFEDAEPTEKGLSKVSDDSEPSPSASEALETSANKESIETKPSTLQLNAPQPSTTKAPTEPANGELGSPGEIRFLSWNVESEGANPDVICKQLSELNKEDRYDIVGLTEVMPQDLKKFRLALGMHYKYAYSKSGYNDRLQLLYNEDVYEKVRHFEIKEINVNGRYRSPLVVHLKHRESGSEFLAMLNHLARGKEKIRQQQATMLVEWAREQTLPIIAIGDYNFDYVFETKKGNPAFVNMMRDGIWKWVEPVKMIDTNWFDNPRDPDGKDDYPGSMLDFAFVANAAKTWTKTCRIIVRDGDFPDDDQTSDHRPFELIVE
jgi:endonuclease/exonuclease/phosphatase family metal-dependent hydrolase